MAIGLLMASALLYAQNNDDPAHAFDFWVGQWHLEWKNREGLLVKGSNTIKKILDGTVIQEFFIDPHTGFKGTSISVYNKKKKEWHQAWADNRGGFFNFIGQIEGDRRIFKTRTYKHNPQAPIQRMVFYNITDNHFTWDWQSSTDQGKSWKLLWRIHYTRSKE